MSHTPHDLHDEFPGQTDLLHRLKMENPHFSRLADQYHDINRAIHRAEARIDPVSEQAEADMRRRRMHLKDDIARLLGELA